MRPLRPASHRDRGIDVLKGLTIVGIVWHHLARASFLPETRDALNAVVVLFSWSVFVFVGAAGFLHARSLATQSRSTGQFALDRARRLLLPWVVLIVGYAALWQVLQITGAIRSGGLPLTFFGKLAGAFTSLGTGVAVQLYFLPVLFCLSLIGELAVRTGGTRGITAVCALALLAGLVWFPSSGNAGFSTGVLVWDVVHYCAGFLLFRIAPNARAQALTLAGCLGVVALLGISHASKVIPVLLLIVREPIAQNIPASFIRVGNAAGSIYAYHYPFGLLLALAPVSWLPTWWLQFPVALLAGAAVILVCVMLHQCLLTTRWRRMLL